MCAITQQSKVIHEHFIVRTLITFFSSVLATKYHYINIFCAIIVDIKVQTHIYIYMRNKVQKLH